MNAKISWRPSNVEIRKFGWTILIGFGAIGSLFFLKGRRDIGAWMWGASTIVFLLSLTIPSIAKPFYWLWMAVGMIIGAIMSRLVMMLIFFFVLTPVALIFRLIRRDALRRKPSAKNDRTHWTELPKISDSKYYDHLF